jgi:hypothetical protein
MAYHTFWTRNPSDKGGHESEGESDKVTTHSHLHNPIPGGHLGNTNKRLMLPRPHQ